VVSLRGVIENSLLKTELVIHKEQGKARNFKEKPKITNIQGIIKTGAIPR
jgi:hypothetical protein